MLGEQKCAHQHTCDFCLDKPQVKTFELFNSPSIYTGNWPLTNIDTKKLIENIKIIINDDGGTVLGGGGWGIIKSEFCKWKFILMKRTGTENDCWTIVSGFGGWWEKEREREVCVGTFCVKCVMMNYWERERERLWGQFGNRGGGEDTKREGK